MIGKTFEELRRFYIYLVLKENLKPRNSILVVNEYYLEEKKRKERFKKVREVLKCQKNEKLQKQK